MKITFTAVENKGQFYPCVQVEYNDGSFGNYSKNLPSSENQAVKIAEDEYFLLQNAIARKLERDGFVYPPE